MTFLTTFTLCPKKCKLKKKPLTKKVKMPVAVAEEEEEDVQKEKEVEHTMEEEEEEEEGVNEIQIVKSEVKNEGTDDSSPTQYPRVASSSFKSQFNVKSYKDSRDAASELFRLLIDPYPVKKFFRYLLHSYIMLYGVILILVCIVHLHTRIYIIICTLSAICID